MKLRISGIPHNFKSSLLFNLVNYVNVFRLRLFSKLFCYIYRGLTIYNISLRGTFDIRLQGQGFNHQRFYHTLPSKKLQKRKYFKLFRKIDLLYYWKRDSLNITCRSSDHRIWIPSFSIFTHNSFYLQFYLWFLLVMPPVYYSFWFVFPFNSVILTFDTYYIFIEFCYKY